MNFLTKMAGEKLTQDRTNYRPFCLKLFMKTLYLTVLYICNKELKMLHNSIGKSY